MKKSIVLLCLMIWGIQLMAQNNVVVSQSKATFEVKNLGVLVKGQIRGLRGEVRLDQDSSFIQVALDIRAIRTGIKMRDEHLLEKRFFHKEMYPTLTFKSKEITHQEDGYTVLGDLTIKDVTQTIEVPFTKKATTYEGAFSLNRKDYHVDNDEFISRGIADTVNIVVTIKVDPEL